MTHGINGFQDMVDLVKAIEHLRTGTACSVEIICDNCDFNGHKNNAIIVSGEWTTWQSLRYEGDTLLACLRDASKDKRNKEQA